METNQPEPPRVTSRDDWLLARRALLEKEKYLTRLRDQLNAERRRLPWVRVEKPYRFVGVDGPLTIAGLFDGRSQLIVQHFMFGPGWEEGCVGCSFTADHIDAARQHFEQNDLSFVAVSRAPWPELEAYRRRMGWRFPWVSSFESEFNHDYHVSFRRDEIARGQVYYNWAPRDFQSEEMSGTSVFAKDAAGDVFHTYSTYARGDELLVGAYNFLDLTPKGRNENGPNHDLTDWVRHHDRYGHGGSVDSTGRYQAAAGPGRQTNGRA